MIIKNIFSSLFSTWVQKTLLSHRENSVNLLITKQIFCLAIYHIETYMTNKDSFHFNPGMIQNQDFFRMLEIPKPTLQKIHILILPPHSQEELRRTSLLSIPGHNIIYIYFYIYFFTGSMVCRTRTVINASPFGV